jgi:hypothetical protein
LILPGVLALEASPVSWLALLLMWSGAAWLLRDIARRSPSRPSVQTLQK